jgi:hypothetical protein
VECEPFPAGPIGAAILELGRELLDPNKILVAVLVLNRTSEIMKNNDGDKTHLGILARDFNLINLAVLELRQIMTQKRQRLETGS